MGRERFDFSPAVQLRGELLQFVDLDLSVARDRERVRITGKNIFIPNKAFDDETTVSATKSTGVAFARINSTAHAAILLQGGTLYQLDAFDDLYVSNAAQADKMLRLYYSTGLIIQPFTSDIVVSGAVEVAKDYNAHKVGASFYGNFALAAVTTIVTPGANVNGLILRTLSCYPGAQACGLYADTAAPAAYNDASKRQVFYLAAAPSLLHPHLLIPAGYGLYAAPSGSLALSCTWDLL